MLAATRAVKMLGLTGARTFACSSSKEPFNRLVLIRHGESQWNKENRFTAMWEFLFGDKSALSPAKPLISQKTNLFDLPQTDFHSWWEQML